MINATEKIIITKYLDNEATDSELKYLHKWLQIEQNQKIFKEFIKTEYLLKQKYKSFDSVEAFSNFLKDIQGKKKIHFIGKIKLKTWMKYAAIFVGLIFITTFLLSRNDFKKSLINPNEISLQVSNGSVETFYIEDLDVVLKKNGFKIGIIEKGKLTHSEYDNSKKAKLFYNTLRIPNGKRYEVILSDGTNVYMNSGSELKYPSYFSENSPREVYLKGEAFFVVTKDLKNPFIVRTEDLNTKVFGTTFNVSAYTNDEITEVVLVEGSIGVQVNEEMKGDYLFVKPSQRGYKLKNSKEVQLEYVNVEKYIAWKNGILMFENESTEHIFKVLERRFNIIIQNNYTDLNKLFFTGTFEHENIEEILNTIKNHTPFNYTMEGIEIIINE